VKIGDRVIVIN
jgi:UDP-N-acetylglucosamine transferase subunit ALG13